ncbi:MAG TPA: hypothetical protein VFS46_09040 [Nitrososphaera sp.]|nr:hypothetical protein [Nitrososphaera sp.]
MTVGLDKGDVDFLQELGIFASTGDGIRFAIKLMRLYSIPTIKTIKKEIT